MKAEKVAIVTGASQGIGSAVALGLAEEGYNLVLIARSENKLIEFANQIKKHGVKTKIVCLDVSNFTAIPKVINEVINEWGRIDILVNNAGIHKPGSAEISLEDFQKLFDVNVKAQLAFIQAVLPVMQKQKQGYIFNIASIAGKTGYAGTGGYASTKFALVGFSESLYREYSSQGIKITAICPSWVDTDMAAGADIPRSKMIRPQDILQTLRWLLSLSPSAFIKEIVLECEPS